MKELLVSKQDFGEYMTYQVKVTIFPLDKKEILNLLDQKGIKYNDFFKLYIGYAKYKSITRSSKVNVEIIKLYDLALKNHQIF